MSGKRLAFVLAIFILGANAVNAETIEFDGILGKNESGMNVSSSGIGMNRGLFPFGRIREDRGAEVLMSRSEAGPRPEDLILARWKEKQMERWGHLPEGKFEINASAYTASSDECGKSDGITASGLKVEKNRTLACPSSYPFGAKLSIEGLGIFRCEDRGGAIKGNNFDIYMETKREAFTFGRRHLMAEVIFD